MVKKIIFISIFIITILTSSIYAYCFDKKPGPIEMNEEPEFSYVKITTIGSALGLKPILSWDGTEGIKWKKSEGSFLLQGVGFVINGGYIITAAHVVNPLQITTNIGKYSRYIDKPIKVLHRSIIITSETEIDQINNGAYAKIYYLNIEHDIAILKFEPDNIYEPVPYELTETKFQRKGGFGGYSSLLQPGDSVAVVVRCRDKDGDWTGGFEVRYGKIISEGIKGVPKRIVPAFSMNSFTTDATIYPGDSGSAIFAFSLGKPVIVGVVIATNDTPSPFGGIPSEKGFMSYATRIDFVKKILESE